MSYRFSDSLRAASSQQTCTTYTIVVCTAKNSWWWSENLTETCRVLFQKWICEQQALSKPVWHIPLLCVQRKSPDDGQRIWPKHVEFYPKNEFEKLVHLVAFILRIYLDARSTERQICVCMLFSCRFVCAVNEQPKTPRYKKLQRTIFKIGLSVLQFIIRVSGLLKPLQTITPHLFTRACSSLKYFIPFNLLTLYQLVY